MPWRRGLCNRASEPWAPRRQLDDGRRLHLSRSTPDLGADVTQADLDRLCAEALQRLEYFINRCAAQQLQRMRESWRKS